MTSFDGWEVSFSSLELERYAEVAPQLFRFAFRLHDGKLATAPRLLPEHWFVTIADYEAY